VNAVRGFKNAVQLLKNAVQFLTNAKRLPETAVRDTRRPKWRPISKFMWPIQGFDRSREL